MPDKPEVLPWRPSRAEIRHWQVYIQQDGSLVITVWHEKNQLALLSTSTDPQEKDLALKRCQKDVPAPPAAVTYNKFMGGVDHVDQLCQSYSILWKSKE
jgi:hypothetical protein